MRSEWGHTIGRLLTAMAFQTLLVLFLLLVGSAQRFLDAVMEFLYSLGRWESWIGFLLCVFWTLPAWTPMKIPRRRLVFLAGFFLIFWAGTEVWGAWIVPHSLQGVA